MQQKNREELQTLYVNKTVSNTYNDIVKKKKKKKNFFKKSK